MELGIICTLSLLKQNFKGKGQVPIKWVTWTKKEGIGWIFLAALVDGVHTASKEVIRSASRAHPNKRFWLEEGDNFDLAFVLS